MKTCIKSKRKATKVVLVIFIFMILVAVAFLLKSDMGKHTEPAMKETHTFPEYTLDVSIEGLEVGSIIEDEGPYIAIHYPKLNSQKINDIIYQMVYSKLSEFKSNLPKNQTASQAELYITFEVYQYSENIISFKFETYESSHVIANGVTAVQTVTIDTAKEHKYNLHDIIKNEESLSHISEYIYNYFSIQDDFKNSLGMLKSGLQPQNHNFDNFVLEENHIEFFFNQCKIAPGSLGVLSCKIDIDDISKYLTEEFETIRPGHEKETPITEENVEIDKDDVNELRDKKLIALTFDDGPHQTNTPKLLDYLEQENVKATFFVLGSRIEYNTDIVRRIVKDGHQIGSHTYHHKRLTKLSQEELAFEINATNELIYQITNIITNAVRPPYGEYNEDVKSSCQMPIINWSVDPEDWKYRDADIVFNSVVSKADDGDIILLHDIHKTSVDAVKRIVPHLKEQGFTFVTVEMLIKARQAEAVNGKVYHKVKAN